MNTPDPITKRKILLTGAAGRIGRAFRELEGERYHLRLVDRNVQDLADTSGHEVVEINVADLAACRRACQGIDAVVHLAADPSPRADFYESLLDNNIKGMYNIFRAAADQGCRRVIFASSIQAIEGLPLDVQAFPDSPPRPLNMYGAAKAFGEATAHYFAMVEGLSCIAIRIGGYGGNNPTDTRPSARNLSAYVSPRDLCHLIVRCIEVEDVRFAVVHGVSDNRFKRMDLTATRQLVGYEPRDDAFRHFGIDIFDHDRWYEEAPHRHKPDQTESK